MSLQPTFSIQTVTTLEFSASHIYTHFTMLSSPVGGDLRVVLLRSTVAYKFGSQTSTFIVLCLWLHVSSAALPWETQVAITAEH